jgi:hypothetical protein
MNVALFKNILRGRGANVSLANILNDIRDGRWRAGVEAVRRPGLSKEERQAAKKRLPAFMASGTSRGGHKSADLLAHSGLLCLDFDDVGRDAVPVLRDTLARDRHVLAAFVSPSGEGVKALLSVPADVARHRQSFDAAKDYISAQYGREIDAKCRDVARLCYVSFDAGLAWNPEAVPLVLQDAMELPLVGAGKAVGRVLSAPHSSSSYILHSTSYLLHNKALFQDWPDLKPHYVRHVARRYGKPQRGQRNEAIVEITACLFHVVKPELVLAMLHHYRQEHDDVFSDYNPTDFEREARAMLDGCEKTFRNELSEPERLAYLALSEGDRIAFRIARSLSCCESDESTPPPLFHLSCRELASRLGLFDMEAGRILQRLEKCGIIEKVKAGTMRTAGQRGRATVWRWLFGKSKSDS